MRDAVMLLICASCAWVKLAVSGVTAAIGRRLSTGVEADHHVERRLGAGSR